ncbi:T-cell activation inhibitor, mitochondrial-like isoform X2 [Mya arenaria]|uniref:T-cell activation inhibitor, mitochondrial-like isoform X2 n=1 Tax=Mya arenaria TaxID=6604 RepID=UPI0022E47C03|nr:T-cell activation inhibitor, mitochondrial-like isoform X2 [Mya arenaria]
MFLTRYFRVVQKRGTVFWTYSCRRHLNSTQTATALRPFYFAVHPDLFGKFPKERAVNDKSLKHLHEYVSSIQANQRISLQPVELNFYLRSPVSRNFKRIRINLKSKDIRQTVVSVLQACGLPLDYVNTLPKQENYSTGERANSVNWYQYEEGELRYGGEWRPKPPPLRTLIRWLKENEERLRTYCEASRQTQEEIDALCERLVSRVGVESVRWENIWGNSHYIACLRTFNNLCDAQLARMRNTVGGRHLVFGNHTGINLHGEVVLGSEDVATDWMMLLRSIQAYDPMIERLPKMEQELSGLLNDIKIMRRHHRKFLMAQTYEVLLNRMLNSLRRSQQTVSQVLGAQDLSNLVLVVECESGPLAVSNGGEFLIPVSVPANMMLKFIAENKEQAATFLIDAKYHTFYMNQTLDQCRQSLNVSQISRDEAVTPKQMTECCQRLLDNRREINHLFQGTKLKVSTYYTLMKDGELTIPWNWLGG